MGIFIDDRLLWAPDIDVEGLRGQKTSPAENMSHTRFAEEVQATQIQESLPCKAVIPITQKITIQVNRTTTNFWTI